MKKEKDKSIFFMLIRIGSIKI